jgi:hypothetical protein
MNTVAFQMNVLRFFCKDRDAKKYIDLIEDVVFDVAEQKVILGLLKGYLKKYKTLPKNPENLIEFFDQEIIRSSKPVPDEVYRKVSDTMEELWMPYENDTEIIKDTIIRHAQYKMAKDMGETYFPKLKEGPEVYERMHKRMLDIINLAAEVEEDDNRGGFLLKEHKYDKESYVDGTPIFLNGVNRMTAAKGFYTPQFVLFMGGPKAFKTGLTLKTAVELMRDGMNVYYADTENGTVSIKNRARQAIMECKRSELKRDEIRGELDNMIPKLSRMGGDMVIDFYPAHSKSISDVESNLEWYKEKYNWVPDVIVYDDPDHFVSAEKKRNGRLETRHNITQVYFEIIRLNHKLSTWALGISQVGKAAVGAEIIDMTAFAEDFAKARNCHAAFAICRTDLEMEKGTARILPVVQREGVKQQDAKPCHIEIDESRMKVEEVDMKKALALLKRTRPKEEA